MKDTLAALNIIVKENTIINKNGVPLLFYWDGNKSTLINSIYEDTSFQSLLYNSVINYENYASAKVTYFYFKYENGDENYAEDFSIVQNEMKLADLDEESRMFYKMYLWNHFTYLYESAYHEKYNKDVTLFDIDECILDIYDKIQNKYPKRVIKRTVINYIRGELQKTDNLSMENADWIIYQLEKLLTERE